MTELVVAPLEELPPGTMKLVEHEPLRIGVYNCGGELHAIEDRCTHDDGPLCLGIWDAETCTIACPRHGASFDLRERAGALASRLPACEDVPGARRRTASSWSRLTAEPEAAAGRRRPGLHPLPRRGMGSPGPRRARDLRAALPRGVPVGALVADDPAQAAGVPGGVRRVRSRAGRRCSARPTSSGCSATPESSAIAARSRRRSRMPARPSRSARPASRWRALLGVTPRRRVPRPGSPADWQATTPESAALAKRLAHGRVPVRRPDDGLRRDASMRRGERPSRRLLGPRRRSSGSGG